MDKPKRLKMTLQPPGRYYKADAMDAWLTEEVLRDLRMHLRLQERHGIKGIGTRALIAELEEADDGK